jgi:hypothetical protein
MLFLGNVQAKALHVFGVVVNLVEGIVGEQPEDEDGHVPVHLLEQAGHNVAGGVAEVTHNHPGVGLAQTDQMRRT